MSQVTRSNADMHETTKSPSLIHLATALALLAFLPAAGTPKDTSVAPGSTTGGALLPQPKSDIKSILLGTYQAFVDDRTLAVSAGTTFYGLLALFPAIASLVSIVSLFADSSSVSTQMDALTGFLPGGALDIIKEQITRITSKGDAALGGAFALGLLTSVWSANAGIKAMFDALNVAYGLKERRGFIALNAIAMAFTVGFIALTALSAFLLVVLTPLLQRFGQNDAVHYALLIGRWPLLFALLSIAIALLYRFGPSPQDRHWRWLTPGSIFAALAWCIVSTAFSYYATNFGSYKATYGSLGAAIGLMTWMWLSITVILLGAELNAQIDKSTDAKREDPI